MRGGLPTALASISVGGLSAAFIPVSEDATIAAIIADEMAIGVINNKTTAVRLIPVPSAKAGATVDFGGLFGSSPILDVRNPGVSHDFVHFGGRIPAPLQSLGN